MTTVTPWRTLSTRKTERGWEVFTNPLLPQIFDTSLLLTNKQDSLESLSVIEIRQKYEEWDLRRESARRWFGDGEDMEMERKQLRVANLDVLGVSRLHGGCCVHCVRIAGFFETILQS
ncbi:uncharacterized protein EDB91DRAFT_1165705 [Suillus paluster]|uniref:uncharacterized protein n=1 Tax=Suillus paluster TaxID=48578 RepID=UPI001B87B955|nr:uncharacterized protein EDB91DRAFT_1165705 [Suillus paluster]KAG1726815.1 hypothetical protein EDB91DRAFT_1165705 [Suillus paluster]